MIFYFHEGRQHNIDDVCVEFCFILELIYSSDFHEGRQYVTGSGKRYTNAHIIKIELLAPRDRVSFQL